jgi:hypothetical protein
MHHWQASPQSASNVPHAKPHDHKILNVVMKWLLQSPLHWLMSRDIMLITFTGRKSGKRFTTPVTYMQRDNQILFFSNQKWWKNLEGGATVWLRVRGKNLIGLATPTKSISRIVEEMQTFLAEKGRQKAYMINLELDQSREPTEQELQQAALDRVVVYIQLEP